MDCRVTENKRLAKNTLLLYVRMILTMIVGLYTSRVILQTLGASDFGLFNVVGGMVSMFAFINTALTGGTSRFLTIAIGRGDPINTEHTFRVALTLHSVISITFLLVIEVIGLLMLRFVLNIPAGREAAAFWVFQFTTLAICVDLIRILMDSEIVAHEKMDYYAYISILEVFLKLLIVFMLNWFGEVDKLLLYGFLYLLTTIVVMLISTLYCKNHFSECKMKFMRDDRLSKEIGSYTGWNILSHISYMISSQGINVALNVFMGTVVNAARGLSVQVNGAVTRFSNNYSVATGPQIVKLYATDKIQEMFQLAKNVSKFSAYLYFLVGIPLFIEMDNALQLWLIEVPPHTALFCRVLLIQGFFFALYNSLQRVLGATGKIKIVNVIDLGLQTFDLILIVLLLWLNINVDLVICFVLLPNFASFCSYLYYTQKYTGAKAGEYILEIIPRILIVCICAVLFPYMAHGMMAAGFVRIVVVTLLNLLTTATAVFVFGIDKDTRLWVFKKIKM